MDGNAPGNSISCPNCKAEVEVSITDRLFGKLSGERLKVIAVPPRKDPLDLPSGFADKRDLRDQEELGEAILQDLEDTLAVEPTAGRVDERRNGRRRGRRR